MIRDDGYADGTIINEFRAKMEAPKVTVYEILKATGPATREGEVVGDALSYILDMVYVTTMREEEGGTYGAQSVSRYYDEPYNEHILLIAFDTNEQQAERLCELSIKSIEDIAANGPSAEDFDKALKNLQKSLPEDRLSVAYWESAIKNNVLYGGNYDAEYEAAVNALTPEKIQAAAAELLSSGNFVKVEMLPEAAE